MISPLVFQATLAALLHDIGKPFQRAVKSDKTQLCEAARNMHGLVGRGDKSYAHALWTSDFINKHRDTLLRVGVKNVSELDASASCHHNPAHGNIMQHIVCEADRASAGMDRQSYVSKGDDADNTQTPVNLIYYARPLDSLFSRIRINPDNQDPTRTSYCPGLLHETEKIFPVRETTAIPDGSYAALCTCFSRQFDSLDTVSPERFLEALASLITHCFWSVPSSTMEPWADIPLCDHLITAAAVAAAMSRAWEESGDHFNPSKCRFRWISGDFSGIQNFIFSISGESDKHIAKLLRGRSFMVSLYTILAARMITDTCGLSPINTLSSAAGKFHILLPDTPSVHAAFLDAREQIVTWFHTEFFGKLKLVIDDGVVFTQEDFNSTRFSKVMQKSKESLNRAKRNIFSSILVSENAWIHSFNYENMKKNGKCSLCGCEPAASNTSLGHLCSSFIEYGKKLAVGSIIVSVKKTGNDSDIFKTFHLELLSKDEYQKYGKRERVPILYKIGGYDQSIKTFLAHLHYACTTPAVEKETAEKTSEAAKQTFEQIAQKAEGLHALAMLKADVDNLGFIFSQGLKQGNTLSQRTALSRMVNWFFAGYLPTLLKEKKFENVYTLFAGGDDLCLIGPWNVMIELAVGLQEKFHLFTGENDHITLSAGIELFHIKYPVSRVITRAEQLLERSKDEGRNRVTFFGQTMQWGETVHAQIQFANQWKAFTLDQEKNSNPVHRAMLYRFFNYWKNWKDTPDENIEKLRHRFLFIYDINRNLTPKKNQKDWRTEKPFCDLLITRTPDLENTPVFQHLGAGITIAMYKERTSNQRRCS